MPWKAKTIHQRSKLISLLLEGLTIAIVENGGGESGERVGAPVVDLKGAYKMLCPPSHGTSSKLGKTRSTSAKRHAL